MSDEKPWCGQTHRILPRYFQRTLQTEATKRNPKAPAAQKQSPTASSGNLRGIPVIGRGVSGASPGSSPLGALMQKQPREP